MSTTSPDVVRNEITVERASVRDRNYRAAQMAEKMIGVPYRWGGAAPSGFDCSGLVYYAYRQFGVVPPRRARDQYSATQPVEPRALRPGDLLFFRLGGRGVSHVGIYLDGSRFVHAPAKSKRVSYADLNEPYWRSRFIRAGRF